MEYMLIINNPITLTKEEMAELRELLQLPKK